jgi:hypothetical protein
VEEFFQQYAKPLLMFGVSIAGSAIQGKITKKSKRIDNDRIPVQNGATWGSVGIGVGAVTDDPLTMVAGFAGAIITSFGHKLIGKLFGNKVVDI